MPRPKSDLTPQMIRLSDEDVAKLREIAEHLGLTVAAGSAVGQPDRSAAARLAIRETHARMLAKAARKKSEKNPG